MEFKKGDRIIVRNWTGIIDDFHDKVGEVLELCSRFSTSYCIILFDELIHGGREWSIEKKYLQLHQSKFHKYVI